MGTRTIILLLVTNLFVTAEAQKGEKTIAAGLLLAFPETNRVIYSDNSVYNIGVGLEGIGQFNFTEKSAALLQLQLTGFSGYEYYDNLSTSFISLSLKGGYRYQFTASGFYTNFLAGVEDGNDGSSMAAALGIGKRFTVKDVYFLDAGIDYTGGYIRRYNIKMVFSLLRRPKVN